MKKILILFSTVLPLVMLMAQTEICGNGIDDDGDGYIDSYDSDCFTGPAPSCFAAAPDNTFGIQLNVQGPANALDVSIAPTIGDIDNDGKIEIIAPLGDSTQGYIVYEVNGTAVTQEPYQYNISLHQPVNGTVSQPAIADLDRNGTSEIICVGADGYVYVFEYTGGNPASYKWRSDLTTDTYWGSPRISDIDEDGVPEIIVGNDIFRFTPGLAALNRAIQGSNTLPIGQDAVPSLWASDIVVIDILASNPGKEIVAGSVVYGVDFSTNTLTILKNLSTISSGTVPADSDGPTAVADLDGDGDLDIVYQSRTTGRVYAWDPNSNQILLDVPSAGNGNPTWASEPTIAYVYDDTKNGYATDLPEIIIANRLAVTAYNLQFPAGAGKRVWQFTTTDTSAETGITAFDFNGDGVSELVYNDETTIRIINGNTTAPVALSSFGSGTLTWMEHPVVADVDNDGQAEMVAFTGAPQAAGGQGRLNIFNPTAGNVWQPARKVWNQRGYRIVNINDDLTVPVKESNSTNFMPATSARFKTLNQYNVQFNPDNLRTEPGMIIVPDAQLTSLTYNGSTKTLQMMVTVAGSSDLPAGTPVTVYKGDPRIMNASVVQTLATPEVISSGTSSSLNFTGIDVYSYDYYTVINDNGSRARPFSLSTDFPSTGTPECNYTNNIRNLSAADTDTDGDGIPDDADLDDDNDGIPDIDESSCNNSSTASFEPLTQAWQDTSIDMTAGQTYKMLLTGSSLGTVTASGGPDNGKSFYPISYGSSGGRISDYDGNSYTRAAGSSTAVFAAAPGASSAIAFANLSASDYINSLTFIGMIDVNGNGQYDAGTDQLIPNILDMSEGPSGGVVFTAPASGRFRIVFTDSEYSDNTGTIDFVMQTCGIITDTDGDTIPDHLDTDSDGDGCPDAVEGSETVRITQVYPLNYPVAGLRGQIKVLADGFTAGTPQQVISTVAAANGIPQLVNNAISNNSNAAGLADNSDTTADAGQGIGTSTLANVQDIECSRCFRPANTSGPSTPSGFGITALNRAGSSGGNWPMKITGAHMVLDSKTKGLVINRVPFTGNPSVPAGITAAHYVIGMMVYDTTNNCLKIYDGTGWYCYTRQTCDNLNE